MNQGKDKNLIEEEKVEISNFNFKMQSYWKQLNFAKFGKISEKDFSIELDTQKPFAVRFAGYPKAQIDALQKEEAKEKTTQKDKLAYKEMFDQAVQFKQNQLVTLLTQDPTKIEAHHQKIGASIDLTSVFQSQYIQSVFHKRASRPFTAKSDVTVAFEKMRQDPEFQLTPLVARTYLQALMNRGNFFEAVKFILSANQLKVSIHRSIFFELFTFFNASKSLNKEELQQLQAAVSDNKLSFEELNQQASVQRDRLLEAHLGLEVLTKFKLLGSYDELIGKNQSLDDLKKKAIEGKYTKEQVSNFSDQTTEQLKKAMPPTMFDKLNKILSNPQQKDRLSKLPYDQLLTTLEKELK